MKKIFSRFVLAISLMFASIANANVILSLDPVTQPSTPGDIISVTIMIDGLGDFEASSLGGFNLDILFDASILSFTSYSLFDSLGDVDLLEADDFSWGLTEPGKVNVSEVSYLFDFELWDMQPGSFALAELFFSVNQSGINQTTSVSFGDMELTDAVGQEINVDRVNDAAVSIPTPATLMLMGLGLLIMLVGLKRSPPRELSTS